MTIRQREIAITALAIEKPGITEIQIAHTLTLSAEQVRLSCLSLCHRGVIEVDGLGFRRRQSVVRAWRAS